MLTLDPHSESTLETCRLFGKCRWEGDNPLENATQKPWEHAAKVHYDFRGVDFWFALFCPYRDYGQSTN